MSELSFGLFCIIVILLLYIYCLHQKPACPTLEELRIPIDPTLTKEVGRLVITVPTLHTTGPIIQELIKLYGCPTCVASTERDLVRWIVQYNINAQSFDRLEIDNRGGNMNGTLVEFININGSRISKHTVDTQVKYTWSFSDFMNI